MRLTAKLQAAADHDIERRIAQRLARLRAERGWSLDALAERTGISRATLSRLERSELSPTAAMLGKYGQPTSEWMTTDGFDPGYQDYYSYDPGKAKQLLKQTD